MMLFEYVIFSFTLFWDVLKLFVLVEDCINKEILGLPQFITINDSWFLGKYFFYLTSFFVVDNLTFIF